MSEEFCDGVKILLKRMESNPEEFKPVDSIWGSLIPKTSGGFYDWGHALTEEETKALAEGMRKIYRAVYTEKVMSVLLEDKEENPYVIKQAHPGSWVSVGGPGGGGSGFLATNNTTQYNPYQNSITYPPNQTNTPIKKPTLGEVLKQKLAKL